MTIVSFLEWEKEQKAIFTWKQLGEIVFDFYSTAFSRENFIYIFAKERSISKSVIKSSNQKEKKNKGTLYH